METKDNHMSKGQRDFEEWSDELLSDPQNRATYERELERLIAEHKAAEAKPIPKVQKAPHASRPISTRAATYSMSARDTHKRSRD
jgi:ABC-type Zn uptake system ZnuABC Zn-binding protein ZnuA